MTKRPEEHSGKPYALFEQNPNKDKAVSSVRNDGAETVLVMLR